MPSTSETRQQLMEANLQWLADHGHSVQGNILRPHGRDHVAMLFFKLPDSLDSLPNLKLLLAQWAKTGTITSAAQQKKDAELWKKSLGQSANLSSTDYYAGRKISGSHQTLFTGLYLSDEAMARLEQADEADIPLEEDVLEAPATPPSVQEQAFKMPGTPIKADGMLLLAHQRLGFLQNRAPIFEQRLQKVGIQIVGRENGQTSRNRHGHSIEHFGFADGISQPVFGLSADERNLPFEPYDPLADVSDFFEMDSVGSFRSHLAYLKMEQDVQGFIEAEMALRHSMQAEGFDHPGNASGLMMGRTRDGMPIADPSKTAVTDWNAFNYQVEEGAIERCPFHAHTRKMNDRSGGAARHDLSILRRGIPYDDRAIKVPATPLVDDALAERLSSKESEVAEDRKREWLAEMAAMPSGEVGLHFMSFQKSPEAFQRQFEKALVSEDPDPILHAHEQPAAKGVKSDRFRHRFPGVQAKGERTEQGAAFQYSGFGGFVKTTASAGFYAPSLDWLKSLEDNMAKTSKKETKASREAITAAAGPTIVPVALYDEKTSKFLLLMSQQYATAVHCYSSILATMEYGSEYSGGAYTAAGKPPWKGKVSKYLEGVEPGEEVCLVFYLPIYRSETLKVWAEMREWGENGALIGAQSTETYKVDVVISDAKQKVHFTSPNDMWGHAMVEINSVSAEKTIRKAFESIPFGKLGHFLFRISVESVLLGSSEPTLWEITGILEVKNDQIAK